MIYHFKVKQMEHIELKVKKLIALWKRGMPNESIAAKSALDRLCDKYGVHIDDIEDDRIFDTEHTIRGSLYQRLFFQVVAMVGGEGYRTRRNGKLVSSLCTVRGTQAQQMEIDALFSHFRPILKEEIEISYRAFVQAQRIFPEGDVIDSDYKLTENDLNTLQRAAQMEFSRPNKRLEA